MWLCSDLEYATEFNPGLVGDDLVDQVLGMCAALLKVNLIAGPLTAVTCGDDESTSYSSNACSGISTASYQEIVMHVQEKFDLDFDPSWVYELDSSTEAKFSRHVILRVPGAGFQNNFHVGAFVKEMCAFSESGTADRCLQQLLVNKVGTPQSSVEDTNTNTRGAPAIVPQALDHVKELGQSLTRGCVIYTQDQGGSKGLFIDGGVYSRNRAFRLFLSSKAGKTAILQPTGEHSPIGEHSALRSSNPINASRPERPCNEPLLYL